MITDNARVPAFGGTHEICGRAQSSHGSDDRTAFWAGKRIFDILVALLALPILLVLAAILLVLNPIWNPGPLLYRQVRMGRGLHPITVWKFRTMCGDDAGSRGPEDPLEVDRITPLGFRLRQTRLDETPQLVNVLVGEMSLLGPRPDTLEHAQVFLNTVPDYAARYSVRPGISGLAQVRMGYAEGSALAAVKTEFDLRYIRDANWRLEAGLVLRTFAVMATGFGAR